jgi:hypothetical protein
MLSILLGQNELREWIASAVFGQGVVGVNDSGPTVLGVN